MRTLQQAQEDFNKASNGPDFLKPRRVLALDLDGTIAEYHGYVEGHIGKPIQSVIDAALARQANGWELVIFTARAEEGHNCTYITTWLEEQGLYGLMITNRKEKYFTEFWDDRAVAVERNLGFQPVSMGANEPRKSRGFADLKFTQIAIWCEQKDRKMGYALGLLPQSVPVWDRLKMNGELNGDKTDSPLSLAYLFNLVDGFEIEYIEPMDYTHWLQDRIKKCQPFISHFGSYCSVETIRECLIQADQRNIEVLQKTVSHSHTNKRSNGMEREYFDVVFSTEKLIGFNIKLTAKANGMTLEEL